MDRRGQGISINVVIIAAIALLILVILSVLVIRSGSTITKGTSCDNLGGVCRSNVDYANNKCDDGEFADGGGVCGKSVISGDPQHCCRKL